jgi:aspartyl-tRNA synthetase
MQKINLIDTPKYLDKEIELSGWVDKRRDHGKLIFFDLRDRSGKVQLVVPPADKSLHDLAGTLRPEWVVKILGKVSSRPETMKNKDAGVLGEIEVKVLKIEVLSEAKTLPFDIASSGLEIGEEVRMKYRYADLRRP